MDGGTTQTTVQNTDPPEWAKPVLENTANAANDYVTRGYGSNFYGTNFFDSQDNSWNATAGGQYNNLTNKWEFKPGNNGLYEDPFWYSGQGEYLVQPFNDWQRTGLKEQAQMGGDNIEKLQTLLAQTTEKGVNPVQQQALDTFEGARAGAFNKGTEPLDWLSGMQTGMYGQWAGGGSPSENTLQGYARGDFLPGGNPYLNQMIDQSQQEARDAIDLSMSASGRYGGAHHAGELGRELSKIGTQARMGQYNQDVGRQFQANQMLDQVRQQNLTGQERALNSLRGLAGDAYGVDAKNTANQLQGAQAVAQMGSGVWDNIDKAFGAAREPTDLLRESGNVVQGMGSDMRQEQARIKNAFQSNAWQPLQYANAIVSGAGNFADKTATVKQPTNWGQVGANAIGASTMAK